MSPKAAVPWKLLREAGHEIVFFTERGEVPVADPRLLSGALFATQYLRGPLALTSRGTRE